MALQIAHWPINLSIHGSKTAHLVPVTTMPTTGQNKTAPTSHEISCGWTSTELLSGSRWKPNRKLLLPVHLGNPTENCFQFALDFQQKTVSWPLIIHPSWYTGGVRHRERERERRERRDEKAMARIRPVYRCKLRVRCSQDGKSRTMLTNYGKVERVWDEDTYVFSFFSLSLSLHLFSPLVHVNDLLLSFCFVMWTVTCRRFFSAMV